MATSSFIERTTFTLVICMKHEVVYNTYINVPHELYCWENGAMSGGMEKPNAVGWYSCTMAISMASID